jgi:hypothetical protein
LYVVEVVGPYDQICSIQGGVTWVTH